MKKVYRLSILLFAISNTCIAQSSRSEETVIVKTESNINPNIPKVSNTYLTKVNFGNTNCISKELQDEVIKECDANVAKLRKTNPNALQKTSQVHPLFVWPTRAKTGFNDYGYFTVQNHVDHNPGFPNLLLDYNCGNRTYDFGSGNHAGVDIIYWPYAWRRMDESVMEIIAAAPGVIVNKRNSFFDKNCSNNGNPNWNGIILEHADGSRSWYWHFKTGSATTKNIGDSVVTGEYLGLAGSSGSSDWPHVHFQVMDSNSNVIDPFDGPCNSMNAGDSWWQSQIPYDVPRINRICTKKTQLEYYSCPLPELTYESDTFNLGDSLWLWGYMRDMAINTTMQINIYNPSNQNVLNFPFTVPWATYPTQYIRWFYVIDAWFVPGWWKFEIDYEGITYEHQFYVTGTTGVGVNNFNKNETTFTISPNPANDLLTVHTKIDALNNCTLVLCDASGRKILSKKTEPLKTGLNTAQLDNGIYFLQLYQSENSKHALIQTKKIVINH
jgi:murein DD-endopeptidase MepM/ murein hydrolase activator NlpD